MSMDFFSARLFHFRLGAPLKNVCLCVLLRGTLFFFLWCVRLMSLLFRSPIVLCPLHVFFLGLALWERYPPRAYRDRLYFFLRTSIPPFWSDAQLHPFCLTPPALFYQSPLTHPFRFTPVSYTQVRLPLILVGLCDICQIHLRFLRSFFRGSCLALLVEVSSISVCNTLPMRSRDLFLFLVAIVQTRNSVDFPPPFSSVMFFLFAFSQTPSSLFPSKCVSACPFFFPVFQLVGSILLRHAST